MIEEVERLLKNLPKDSDASAMARYVGSVGHEKRKKDEQSQLVYLGLRVPQVRDVLKAGFSFSALSDDEQLLVWEKIWTTSKIFEVKSLPLLWLSQKKRSSHIAKNWRSFSKWVEHIDNWGHSDGLSQVYAEALEQNPQLLKTFIRWNFSKNPWERRQSIVGLLYYARLRKKNTSD